MREGEVIVKPSIGSHTPLTLCIQSQLVPVSRSFSFSVENRILLWNIESMGARNRVGQAKLATLSAKTTFR